jgi:hypothetical protein
MAWKRLAKYHSRTKCHCLGGGGQHYKRQENVSEGLFCCNPGKKVGQTVTVTKHPPLGGVNVKSLDFLSGDY